MSRKIVYIKSDNLGFPTLDSIYPASKLLTEDKIVGNTTYHAGQSDPEYSIPEHCVLLLEDDGKNYYSILDEYTNEQLSEVDDEYELKTDLDGNFTYTLLKYGNITNYNKLLELGCPPYDANVHTTYIIRNTIDTSTINHDITTRGEDNLPVTVEENTEGTV